MSEIVLQMLKAQAWEEAKGKLRALAVLAGHKRLLVRDEAAASATWKALDQKIEAFIADIENHGLQE